MSRSAIAIFLTDCEMHRSKICSSFQSSYLKVVPKTFLPPSLPVVHTRNGTEWEKDDKDAIHFSLYQNVSLQNALMPAQAIKKCRKGIPYYYSYPSVDQDDQTTNVLSLWLILFVPLNQITSQG